MRPYGACNYNSALALRIHNSLKKMAHLLWSMPTPTSYYLPKIVTCGYDCCVGHFLNMCFLSSNAYTHTYTFFHSTLINLPLGVANQINIITHCPVGMMSSTTPTPLNATSEPTDLYFIIAIIISVVGGVVVVALIVVIMVMIIMKHRRRGQHNVLRQTPPPPTTNKYKPNSIPQLQTTPITLPQSTGLSSSLSLISIDSNYHSGKFSSHSTLSHSGKSSSNSTLSDSSKAADCPLKYLGTSV